MGGDESDMVFRQRILQHHFSIYMKKTTPSHSDELQKEFNSTAFSCSINYHFHIYIFFILRTRRSCHTVSRSCGQAVFCRHSFDILSAFCRYSVSILSVFCRLCRNLCIPAFFLFRTLTWHTAAP